MDGMGIAAGVEAQACSGAHDRTQLVVVPEPCIAELELRSLSTSAGAHVLKTVLLVISGEVYSEFVGESFLGYQSRVSLRQVPRSERRRAHTDLIDLITRRAGRSLWRAFP